MKKYWIYIILLLLGLSSVGYYFYNKKFANTNSLKADYQFSSLELYSEYNDNEELCNQKYLNKVLQVNGRVKTIQRDDTSVVIQLDSGDELSGVSCIVQNESLGISQSVKEGDSIAIKGICTGKLMDVVLIRCSISQLNN